MNDSANRASAPVLVGSTGNLYSGTISQTKQKEAALSADGDNPPQEDISHLNVQEETNYFKNAQWSPDGTTIITTSADNILRTFILPPDLLSNPNPNPHTLTPYITHALPSPTYATAIHPSYSLSHLPSTLYLLSPRSLPIRLLSPFSPRILASYPLTNPTTEAYIAPHALLFDTYTNANHFFAGSQSCISVFDINRNGEAPLSSMATIPSRRKKIVGGGVGMKGIVSCLGTGGGGGVGGVLAAGTFTRWVGLYDGGGRGGSVGVFEVRKGEGDAEGGGEGTGVTQVLWSVCGRYLCVVERGSGGVGVWDVRVTGRRLSWLKGRRAETGQRLGVEVVGDCVWAGGKDGMVRVWEGLGEKEGVVEPAWEFRAHDDAVLSAVTHPSGTVLATCSGQRHVIDFGDNLSSQSEASDSDGERSLLRSSSISSFDRSYDNSLKVWDLS